MRRWRRRLRKRSAGRVAHFPADLSAEGAADKADALKLSVCPFRARARSAGQQRRYVRAGWLGARCLRHSLSAFPAQPVRSGAVEPGTGAGVQAGTAFNPQSSTSSTNASRNPNGDQLSYTLSNRRWRNRCVRWRRLSAMRARVNGVAPGLVIPTEDYDDVQMAAAECRNAAGASYPMRRQLPRLCSILAGARHVTGQILFVDGGAHLRSYPRDFHASGEIGFSADRRACQRALMLSLVSRLPSWLQPGGRQI
jgi:hypothetical protein